jgi:hypothetical protein
MCLSDVMQICENTAEHVGSLYQQVIVLAATHG